MNTIGHKLIVSGLNQGCNKELGLPMRWLRPPFYISRFTWAGFTSGRITQKLLKPSPT
jgi:hypothetical protein